MVSMEVAVVVVVADFSRIVETETPDDVAMVAAAVAAAAVARTLSPAIAAGTS